MTTYEVISLIISILGLILAGVANIRISSYKSNIMVDNLSQDGSENKQAGRDINN